MARLVIQGLGQPFDGALGGRIERHVRRRQKAQYRADVDDAARTLLTHVRQHGLDRAQQAEEVGVEQRLGFGNRRFFRRAEQGHTRAVDQHVNALGLSDEGMDCAFN